MAEEILINVTPREVRVALLEQGALQDIYIERSLHQGLLGNIYQGKVNRLLPGIQAAFVDIGLDRAAFLHAKDIGLGVTDQDIRDLLHPGQEILVQVYKDPLGSKGARLTTHVTVASRYLVLTPYTHQVVVSQKIVDPEEKQRLLTMIVPERDEGYIFRTAAIGVSQEAIDADRLFLKKVWSSIVARVPSAKPGEVVYIEIPIVLRVLRDLVGFSVEKIRVDDAQAVQQMREFAERYVPELVAKIEYYDATRPIFDMYSVEEQIQKALERNVSLKSGGYIVFDQTEAMTTIDVNTGSYLGHGKIEETIFKTNLEAVDVIAKQVRLRNLGGIIIIDFIDMSDPAHKTQLMERLAQVFAQDKVRVEISELSSLGLVQMTRKRIRESLEHILCVTCPLCQHRGSIKSLQTICYDIFRELKRTANYYAWPGFLVVASESVVNFLSEEESAMLADLEIALAKPIRLQIDSSNQQEHYEILPISEKG